MLDPYFGQVKVTNHFSTTGDGTTEHCFLKGGGLLCGEPLDVSLHTIPDTMRPIVLHSMGPGMRESQTDRKANNDAAENGRERKECFTRRFHKRSIARCDRFSGLVLSFSTGPTFVNHNFIELPRRLASVTPA